MTSQEFVIWLKGFTEGVHEFNITPKQWDILKDKLAEVKDDLTLSPFPFGTPNTAPNTQSFPTWQQPHYVDPINPFKTYCTPGTSNIGTIATTPGVSSITIATPQFTTSTATSLPSGSTIRYTNSTDKTLLND